jgi:hypothetical protein
MIERIGDEKITAIIHDDAGRGVHPSIQGRPAVAGKAFDRRSGDGDEDAGPLNGTVPPVASRQQNA